MSRPPLLLLLLLAAATLAACGSSSDSDSDKEASAPAVSPSALAGRTFVARTLDGRSLAAGTAISISFEQETLSASAGCNTITGGYAIEDGELRTRELARTMIGCDAERERQDEWLDGFLTAGPEVSLDGDRLTLAGDSVTAELRESTADDERPPLTGTLWTLETLMDRNGTASNVPAGVEPPTLRIAPDGGTEVFAGCNRGGGSARVRPDEGLIVFGPLALTRMACDEAANRVEATVTAILDGTTAYSFDGPLLSIAKRGDHLVWRAG